MEERAWRPRWWVFAVFAMVAAVHLAGGWDSTSAVGLSVGFAGTLVLAFVRRLPSWATGEEALRAPVRASRTRLIVALPLALLGVVAVLIGLIDHPPHGMDVLYVGFVAVLAVGLVVVLALRPASGPLSRSGQDRRLRLCTAVLGAAVGTGVALEVAVLVTVGGALPWVVLAPVLLVVGVTAVRRRRNAKAVRLLAAGAWTGITAATLPEEIDGSSVSGWAVFPDGLRARFGITGCPPDVLAGLLDRRRLWIAGEPRDGEVAVGLPDGDAFAVAWFAVKDRDHRRWARRASREDNGSDGKRVG
ncbi:DUF4175 domain-containing protein [Amycolatopsis thermalba]|uniref:DUF4175 domain-containing protein n=1 Tax=Amycolatopsis thermalba TaxID=944492 RepID=A0ABY4NX65_9PSEU|nr:MULTISPECIES: DUF4175 domain-containing protein [Amycolatopsis]UQS24633.1 DUF4175 domain-containing protein [Amycolatopsis thermalba]